MTLLLGCIADDFTGATDLANMLVRGGMRTIQTIGVPTAPLPDEVDAVVIALKSRTIAPADAVAQSLAALGWLKGQGCKQVYFKYCSTFDSTPKGNIGPVTEALMDAMGTDFTIACPAFPENGRTICRGYLFVGDVLLSESGMRNHPLTPMTDASLVRVMQAQTQRKVGLISYTTLDKGTEAVRQAIAKLRSEGTGVAIVDALADAHLDVIAESTADFALVTAGSGVGLGIANAHRRAGRLKHAATSAALPNVTGLSAVVSGSCSDMTNAQVAQWKASRPAFKLDPVALANSPAAVEDAIAWTKDQVASGPVLIYATATPDDVKAAQAELGVARAGAVVEEALAHVAKALVAAGVRKLIVAGGETSGAVVSALGVTALRIGPQIDPGVPWTVTLGGEPIALALKSGNFGTADFFAKALAQLEATR
ncbi:MAG: four-carbon acid sugar kinase family protein [Hyphomicrobiales bacterium]|nr:MAG: four-carbon acid sugar kinase family protein [Hyphomicrobiales bacterium]